MPTVSREPSGYTQVSFTEDELHTFISRWPCCRLTARPTWFEFSPDQDLIDHNIPEAEDGGAAVALSADAGCFAFDDIWPEWLPLPTQLVTAVRAEFEPK
jgi:hypothetical protein